MLAYFVVASIIVLRRPVETSTPDKVLQIALPVTGVLGFFFGLGALHIRKHLFWIRRKINLEEGSGRAIFLGFSIAALTGAALSALTLFAPRMIWGASILPTTAVVVGIVFLIGMFPRLPK